MANPSALLVRPSGGGLSPGSGFWSSDFQSRASVCRGYRFCKRKSGSLCWSAREKSDSGWGLGFERRRRIRCQAQGGEVLPESREEAIEQAAGSVAGLLEKALRRRGPSTVKQRKEQRQVRLRVEVPVLDDTPAALISLTLDLSSALLRKSRKQDPLLAVFFRDAASVELARNSDRCSNVSFHSLHSETDPLSPEVAILLVAGARYDDAGAIQELVRNATPRPVVVLNPDWSSDDEKDATWGFFLTSFEAAYAFLPLAIQGFFSKTEGAVLKHVQSGAPGGKPWLIFVKDDKGAFTRLSSLKARPGPAELESALYNAMAANSPVTKSIKFLRGLVSKE